MAVPLRHVPPLALVLLLAAAATARAASEPFATYDNFGESSINPSLWLYGERTRGLQRKALALDQRAWGLTTSDSGTTSSEFNESIKNPSPVTALRAKVTVSAIEIDACAANTSVGAVRARIVGSFFNIGTPVTGSQVNDAYAQVRLIRATNSTDPVGTLEVQGLLQICANSNCSSGTPVGSTIDLGTVTLGEAATIEMQWSKANKSFTFSRDNGAYTGTVVYTQSDSTPPSVPFMNLSTRMDLQSCTAGLIEGSITSSFDSVSVNKSAAP